MTAKASKKRFKFSRGIYIRSIICKGQMGSSMFVLKLMIFNKAKSKNCNWMFDLNNLIPQLFS